MGIEDSGTLEKSLGSGAESPDTDEELIPESVDMIWSLSNPMALMACLPKWLAKVARHGRDAGPEYYGLDEHELFSLMLKQRREPSPSLSRLRAQLWLVFETARSRGEKLEAFQICAGVCSEKQLREVFLDPIRAAWLFTEPRNYTQILDESLEYGMRKLRTILTMETENPNGSVNVKLLELQVKVIAMLDMRKHGAPTQKIEQKNLNLSGNLSKPQGEMMGKTIEELEAHALDLRRKNLIAQNLPPEVIKQLTETVEVFDVDKRK